MLCYALLCFAMLFYAMLCYLCICLFNLYVLYLQFHRDVGLSPGMFGVVDCVLNLPGIAVWAPISRKAGVYAPHFGRAASLFSCLNRL